MRSLTKSLLGPSLLVALLSGCGEEATSTPVPTAPQGSNGITVTSPNGGETFRVGSALPVSWTTTNSEFTSANITIDCGLKDWYGLARTSIDPSVGDTSLVIPDSVYSAAQRKLIAFPTGSGCKVKVSDYTMTSLLDTSDAPFTVLAR